MLKSFYLSILNFDKTLTGTKYPRAIIGQFVTKTENNLSIDIEMGTSLRHERSRLPKTLRIIRRLL